MNKIALAITFVLMAVIPTGIINAQVRDLTEVDCSTVRDFFPS